MRELLARWQALGGRPVSSHWERTRRSLAKHLVDAVGDLALGELGPATFWQIQRHCLGRGLSEETTNKVTHHLIPALLRDLEDAGEIPPGTRARVMSGAKKLRRTSEPAGRALTLQERDRLLLAAAGSWAAPLVTFLALTGVRVGEAAGLQQRDIDWSRRTIRIARSRRGYEVSATKSRRSQRRILLSHAALAAISPLRTGDPNGWLFRGPAGEAVDVDNFRRREWSQIVRRARLRGLRIHDLRHTFATLCLEAGQEPIRVAEYLGDQLTTVLRVYSHVIAGDVAEAVAPVPALLRRVV